MATIDDEGAELRERAAREHALQGIIDEMVRTDREWTVESAAEHLRGRIEAAGLPARAETWVTAVAEGVLRGEAYVVSRTTKREDDVPPPPHHLENRVID